MFLVPTPTSSRIKQKKILTKGDESRVALCWWAGLILEDRDRVHLLAWLTTQWSPVRSKVSEPTRQRNGRKPAGGGHNKRRGEASVSDVDLVNY